MTVPVIELLDLHRWYPGPPVVRALDGVDLVVAPGDYLAVVGPSGSGKSTLLNILGLLDKPTSGTYRLDGMATNTLPERDLTALRGRRIGFVFQDFHLLPHRSATENVALAGVYTTKDRAARRVRAVEALDRVGLAHRANACATTLSGGERQRVAIARAVVGRPAVLLCDEPTGNLDSANSQAVSELLGELNADGTTIVVITHDPVTAAAARRSVKLIDGRLGADIGRP